MNLEGWLANQALVDDRPYAPQVGLGVIVLGHDDFWGLERSQIIIHGRNATYSRENKKMSDLNKQSKTH